MKTFEEFLQDYHADLFPQLLDDEMPDHFNNWLSNLEAEDFMRIGELYGKFVGVIVKEELLAKLKPQ